MLIGLMLGITSTAAAGAGGYWTDPGNYDTSWYADPGASSYTISSAADLAGLAQLNNNGTSFSGKTIVFSDSIDLSAHYWTPIGTSAVPFQGTLDGNMYSVSGMTISTTSGYQGLFGRVTGTVKNVGVIGSNIYGSGSYIGGLVGYCSSGSTVTDCYSTGTVSGATDVGGLVGYCSSGSTVTDCYNTGAISGAGSYVGGVVGSSGATVQSCYNTGTVSGAGSYVGGVVGYSNASVTNCYNTGTISGDTNVGGVVGYNTGTLSDNYYIGCARGIGSSSVDGSGTTPFIKLASSSLAAGSLTTIVEETDLAELRQYFGSSLAISYSPCLSGDTSVATVSGTTVTAVGAGLTNITGTIMIAQNQLTAGGFNGTSMIVPGAYSLALTVHAVVPGAPTIGTATAGDGQATVTFSAPASNGGSQITGYTATSSAGGMTGTGTSSPITVTGLTDGTAYTFTVTATNGAGTGTASAVSNSVTPVASQTITFNNPGPQNFGTTPTLTATSTSGLTPTFTTSTPTVCTTTSGGSLTFLTAGTATINADQAGNSAYLAASTVSQSFTVNAVVPGAPTIGTATAGDGQATVTFSAPASNGGSQITGYTATSSAGGMTGSGTSSPITVTGLTDGTAYTFTVTATNGVGTGTASAASNSVTPVAPSTVPGAPTGVVAIADNTQATVSFTAPASDGGSAITGYTVISSPGGIIATGTACPIIVNGLTNGTAYTFTVTATNAVGTSVASTASASVTPSTGAILTFTYNGNGNTGGVVPTGIGTYDRWALVTVLANTGNLSRTGYTFAGWNTAAGGSGTSYEAGNVFTINSDIILYTQWTSSSVTTVQPPTITPRGGNVTTSQSVSITDPNLASLSVGDAVYYTLNNTEPTLQSTPSGIGSAFNLDQSAEVSAAVYNTVYGWSQPTCVTFTFIIPETSYTVIPTSIYAPPTVVQFSNFSNIGITPPTVDVSSLLITSPSSIETAPLPPLVIQSSTSASASPSVIVSVYAGTTISALSSSSWNGSINVPTAESVSSVTIVPDQGDIASVDSVIEIGRGDTSLTFNQPVQILFSGQAGKHVGYYQNGVFNEISPMSPDSVADLGQGQCGCYDSGSDLVVWTMHFTKYVIYTETAQVALGNNTGGGTASPVLVPTVQTGVVSSVTSSAAVLNGDITSDNGYDITEYGFLWGTDIGSLTNTLQAGSDNHSGNFTDTLGGLTAGTTYYFQTYAKSSEGIGYGATISFITAGASQATATTFVPTTFPDVPTSYWAHDTISNLNGLGYISGYPDGTFRPDNQITRAEFCAIMDKVLNLTTSTLQAQAFTDVNQADWFTQAVDTAVYAGIVKGYGDGTFHPNTPISRQEMACVLVQALGKSQLADSNSKAVTKFVDDHDIAWWSRGYVSVASKQGIINGYPDGDFMPGNETTRAEACVMVGNFLNIK
jgi:hypothetical protein